MKNNCLNRKKKRGGYQRLKPEQGLSKAYCCKKTNAV